MQQYKVLYKNTRKYTTIQFTQQDVQQYTIICKNIQCHTILYKNIQYYAIIYMLQSIRIFWKLLCQDASIDLQPLQTQKCCYLQYFQPLKSQKCCYFQYLQPLETQKCCSVQYFQLLKAQNCCYIQYLQPLWELRNAAIFSSSCINAVFFRYLANGQNCRISERLRPPLRLQEAFEAFSKLFFDPKKVFF